MKNFINFLTVSLILFSINYGISFSQEKPKSLDQIFTPYKNIIDELIDSNLLLKDWNNLEYLIFLNELNSSFLKYKVGVNSRFYPVRKTAPIFIEIFGGLKLQSEINDTRTIFISENLIDYGRKNYRISRLDGILAVINNDEIIIHNVLEATFKDDVHDVLQNERVFEYWKDQGMYVSNIFFSKNNIKLRIKEENENGTSYSVKPITECEFKDFEKIVEIYTGKNFDNETDDNLSLFKLSKIPYGIRDSFDSIKSLEVLEKLNIEFVDRILFLLKKYIQTYNKIPSIPKDVDFSLIDEKGLSNKDKAYYDYYFGSNNDKNIKDLMLTFHSILNTPVLYSFFQERLTNFFNTKTIRSFYIKLWELGFTDYHKSMVEVIADTLEELLEKDYLEKKLGTNYKLELIQYLKANRISFFSINRVKYDYKSLLTSKFYSIINSTLLNTLFNVDELKDLILTDLGSFIHMYEFRVDRNLPMIGNILENMNLSKESKKSFIKQHLFQVLSINCDSDTEKIIKGNIEYISRTFGLSLEDALFFVFSSHILNHDDSIKDLYNELIFSSKDIEDSSIEENSYFIMNTYKDEDVIDTFKVPVLVYFPTKNKKFVQRLFLSNIRTLKYVKIENFYRINDILLKAKFNIFEKEEFLINNLKYFYFIMPDILEKNISFISNYFKTKNYTDNDFKKAITYNLYNIYALNIDNANEIINYLNSVDTSLFDRLVYKWLVEKDHTFDNIDVNKIKEAIIFLEEKLDHNKKLVSDFISQMNDIDCLDKDLLELIYEVSQQKEIDFFDSSSMIKEIYAYLTDANYQTSIIFLNKEEKKVSNKKIVEEIISSNICKMIFSKK